MQALKDECIDDVSINSLTSLCSLLDSSCNWYSELKVHLRPIRNDPILSMLIFDKKPQIASLDELFVKAEKENTPETTAHLLQALLVAKVDSTFYKINVHAAMTPAEIKNHLEPVFVQAKILQEFHKKKLERVREENTANMESSTSQHSVLNSTTSFSTATNPDKEIPFVTVN